MGELARASEDATYALALLRLSLSCIVTAAAETERKLVITLTQLQLTIFWQYLVEVNQIPDQIEFRFCGLVFRIKFECFLKLML